MSRVLNCCRRSPLTQVSTSMFAGSSSPTTMHGPSEHDWSKFFAMPNLSGPCGLRRAPNAPVAQQGHAPDQIPGLGPRGHPLPACRERSRPRLRSRVGQPCPDKAPPRPGRQCLDRPSRSPRCRIALILAAASSIDMAPAPASSPIAAIPARWSAKLPPAHAMREPFGRGACRRTSEAWCTSVSPFGRAGRARRRTDDRVPFRHAQGCGRHLR